MRCAEEEKPVVVIEIAIKKKEAWYK